jgi:excisionase family DNA binding protein
MDTDHKLMHALRDASEITSVGRTKLYEEMEAGRLSFVKVGKRRLIPHGSLVAYVELLEREARDRAAQCSSV